MTMRHRFSFCCGSCHVFSRKIKSGQTGEEPERKRAEFVTRGDQVCGPRKYLPMIVKTPSKAAAGAKKKDSPRRRLCNNRPPPSEPLKTQKTGLPGSRDILSAFPPSLLIPYPYTRLLPAFPPPPTAP